MKLSPHYTVQYIKRLTFFPKNPTGGTDEKHTYCLTDHARADAWQLARGLFHTARVLDIAIPFAGLAVVLVFFFKSKGGMASRHLDMSIQGSTGIRMEQAAPVNERSYILIGAILYLVVMVGLTFFMYREYFLN